MLRRAARREPRHHRGDPDPARHGDDRDHRRDRRGQDAARRRARAAVRRPRRPERGARRRDEARVEGRFVSRRTTTRSCSRASCPVVGRSRGYVDGRLATVARARRGGARRSSTCTGSTRTSRCSRPPNSARSSTERAAHPRAAAHAELHEARGETRRRLDDELGALGGDERARAREIDLLRYQLAEIDAARHHRARRGRASSRRRRRSSPTPKRTATRWPPRTRRSKAPPRTRSGARSARSPDARRSPRSPSGLQALQVETAEAAHEARVDARVGRRRSGAAGRGAIAPRAPARADAQVRRRRSPRSSRTRTKSARGVADLEAHDARAAALEAERPRQPCARRSAPRRRSRRPAAPRPDRWPTR